MYFSTLRRAVCWQQTISLSHCFIWRLLFS